MRHQQRSLKPTPRPTLVESNLVIEAKRHLDTAFRMFDDAPNKVNHDRLVEAQRIYLCERELARSDKCITAC